MSILIYNGSLDLNTSSAQQKTFTATGNNFIVTDVVLAYDGDVVNNAHGLYIEGIDPATSSAITLAFETHSAVLQQLQNPGDYAAFHKPTEFSFPNYRVIGNYLNFYVPVVEGATCLCRLQIWGYSIAI